MNYRYASSCERKTEFYTYERTVENSVKTFENYESYVKRLSLFLLKFSEIDWFICAMFYAVSAIFHSYDCYLKLEKVV